MNLTMYMAQMSTMNPQLSTMPMGTTYPQPPQGGLQQHAVQPAPMAQQVPFQGQQLLLPPQAYPPGNFPGQITPWIGRFGPGPATPQPNVGWESAIASVVAAQMSQLHQELKEMKEGDEEAIVAPRPDHPNGHGLITRECQMTLAIIAPIGGMNIIKHADMLNASLPL